MKKMTFISLMVLLVFGLLFSGCPASPENVIPNNPINPNKKIPGKFAVTKLSDTMGAARGISLGTYTITNSESIFFILRNVGDFPITDIALTPGYLFTSGTFKPITDNAVNANPSVITVLETSGNTIVESVIKVNINHGDIIGLIAQQYIQKADFAGTTLRITGKTTNTEGAVLDISLDLDIETYIKVASFDVLYSLDDGETFEKAEWDNDGGNFPRYISSNKDYIIIKNTGNMNIKYRNSDNRTTYPSSWITLEPNEYSERLFPSQQDFYLQLDTLGIVYNNQGNDKLFLRPGTSQVGTLSEIYGILDFIIISVQ